MSTEKELRGSQWHKWDLHIHSPASYLWLGNKFTTDPAANDSIISDMIKTMNASDVAAFCIMDYWHFNGWLALREYIARHPGELTKKVFPGIEIRIEAPVDYKLNTHFLFDDSLSKQQLLDFLSTLQIGSTINRPPSPESFAALGRSYGNDKLKEHGYSDYDRADDYKMTKLGMQTAKITRDSWKAAKLLMGDSALIVQPYDTNDGLEDLDWRRHPYDDTELMQLADFFETRNQLHINLFLGKGHPSKKEIAENFFQALGRKWRPVLSGSDAHKLSDYGKYPSGKTCWLKADITFAGLRQCLVDPSGRVFIGEEPKKLRHQQEHKTKYIASISINKLDGSNLSENWFDSKIPLNPGMIAVIGNKGSGKSALADIIALAGNSHRKDFEFLNQQRFRKGLHNRASQFQAKIIWSDSNESVVFLNEEPNLEQPERVRYLPQQYLEQLCTDISKDGAAGFEKELKKVVFSHVPSHQRLGQDTLDNIIQYQSQQSERRANDVRNELTELNKAISHLEHSLSAENIAAINALIDLKSKELIALDKVKPLRPERPTEQDQENSAVAMTITAINSQIIDENKALASFQSAQANNTAAAGAVTRLLQGLHNITANFERALLTVEVDAKIAGLPTDGLAILQVNNSSVIKKQQQLVEESIELAEKIATAQEAISLLMKESSQLQTQASEPERIYQSELRIFIQWEERRKSIIGSKEAPDTLLYWQYQLDYSLTTGKWRLDDLYIKRLELSKEIYTQIQLQIDLYKSLYQPVATAAAAHEFVRDNIQLGFDALIEGISFPDHLLSMLNLAKRGTFYTQADGLRAAKNLINHADLTSWEGVVFFLDSVMQSLTVDQREGRGENIAIQSQLRDTFTVAEIYDIIYGLSYLQPRLTLQLAGKEVSELSPGERGILLLVFYLLLDQEDIPLIIDQPEHNLDNSSVYKLLEPCIRHAKEHRQILLITHNPNVAIVCDAEQIISATIDKSNGNKITYRSGAIENPSMNMSAVDVLEGTWPAFTMRDETYQRLSF